ncbi:MAG TPA: hypothetical protein VHL11_07915 [Phototrophicaceae bacterium]|jgi:hypothetical protein|nr:hypothetical protein [Phototrophicaceae bacterium]
MPVLSYVFFAIFAIVILGTYLALRRNLGNPRTVMIVCMVGSIISMGLTQVARVNADGSPILAGLIGGALGAIGAVGVIVMARYFGQNQSVE